MLEIKILVCYVLTNVKEPMTRKQLCDCLQNMEIVNFFDLNEAIDDLIKHGMINEEDYLCEKYLFITDSGKNNAKTLETDLSKTMRERSVNAALKMVSRAKAERETKVNIRKTETGYYVTFIIEGFGENLLELTLFAADIFQAEQLRDGFLSDAPGVYSMIIDKITSYILE